MRFRAYPRTLNQKLNIDRLSKLYMKPPLSSSHNFMSLRYFLDHTVSCFRRTRLPFNSSQSPKNSLLLQTLIQYIRICSDFCSNTNWFLYLYWHTNIYTCSCSSIIHCGLCCCRSISSKLCLSRKCWCSCPCWKCCREDMISKSWGVFRERGSDSSCIHHPTGAPLTPSFFTQKSTEHLAQARFHPPTWIPWYLSEHPFHNLFLGWVVFILNWTSEHTTTSSGNQKTQFDIWLKRWKKLHVFSAFTFEKKHFHSMFMWFTADFSFYAFSISREVVMSENMTFPKKQNLD